MQLKFRYTNKGGTRIELVYHGCSVKLVELNNKIIRRSIAKPLNSGGDRGFGEILERWSTNSYRIVIEGTIVKDEFNIFKSTEGIVQPTIIPGQLRDLEQGITNIREIIQGDEETSNNEPRKEIDEFIRMLEHKGKLEVIHPKLSSFGIKAVAVEGCLFPKTTDIRMQDFTLKLLSDAKLEENLFIDPVKKAGT